MIQKSDKEWNDSFFGFTDSNAYAANPPNVVFFLMESLSNNNLFCILLK